MNNKRGRGALWRAAAVFLVCFLLSASQILYPYDALLSDPLYQRPGVPDADVRILAVDEKTLAAYGDFADWPRSLPARLVDTLNADPANAPAVIAFDVMYVSERGQEADAAFAASCEKAGNVVTAVNLVYRTALSADGDGLSVDRDHIERIEYPYAALRAASRYGFANTYLDRDQFVRYARLSVAYEGETVWSLPAAAAQLYTERTGAVWKLPETDASGFFHFTYTGHSGDYEVLSLCDVLEGRIPAGTFRNAIVFVGAYAPGMQDAYNAAIQHGAQMYGVEIQANITQALLEGKTALAVAPLLCAVLVGTLAAAYYLAARRLKPGPAALVGAALVGLYLLAARLLYAQGRILRVLEPALAVVALYLLNLAVGYLGELLKKRKILSAFRQYVAPQVVDEVAEKGDFAIRLGGEKRNIAVLFVDIRGFTPLSEDLEPEQVVEILNEYLALTTGAIFRNGGTLDKFIGDATMAVFNAPFDLDDYVYRAVCTARDIAAGSEALDRSIRERFGRSVSFGIGVNCGDAVVGNIGCEFRMDYTAIGDTVNTAARLESKAGRGQILISRSVYEAVKDRVRVTDVGALPLKGKSNEVYIYQLDEVM